jgi:hypothetical protein
MASPAAYSTSWYTRPREVVGFPDFLEDADGGKVRVLLDELVDGGLVGIDD